MAETLTQAQWQELAALKDQGVTQEQLVAAKAAETNQTNIKPMSTQDQIDESLGGRTYETQPNGMVIGTTPSPSTSLNLTPEQESSALQSIGDGTWGTQTTSTGGELSLGGAPSGGTYTAPSFNFETGQYNTDGGFDNTTPVNYNYDAPLQTNLDATTGTDANGTYSAGAEAPASGGQLSLGGAPTGTTATSGSYTATPPADGGPLATFLSSPDPEALVKMSQAGLGEADVNAMAGINSGDPTLFLSLPLEQRAAIKQFVKASMPADAYAEWVAIIDAGKGATGGTTGGTTGTGGTDTGTGVGPNGGISDSPGGGTNVGEDNANLNFTDQGDGVYRGWSSQPPGTPENTTQDDGSVQGNYTPTRGNEFRAENVEAESMSPMEIERMQAAFAAENGREMTPEELSSVQLNDILSQDSPLMSLARQDGINMANSRGLMNSSLAAGASMAEMTRQATPLAMQQADAYGQMQGQNQVLESSRLEANAGREQEAAGFNASAENQATSQEFGTEADLRQFNAGMETNTNITNAGMANDMLNADRQRSMSYALQQLAGDQDFAKQELASTKAIDLANIEGQYKALISENDTAARMFDSTYQSIADILSNSDIHADEASAKVNYLVGNMQAMMESLLAFDNFDFTASGATGTGKNSDFS